MTVSQQWCQTVVPQRAHTAYATRGDDSDQLGSRAGALAILQLRAHPTRHRAPELGGSAPRDPRLRRQPAALAQLDRRCANTANCRK